MFEPLAEASAEVGGCEAARGRISVASPAAVVCCKGVREVSVRGEAVGDGEVERLNLVGVDILFKEDSCFAGILLLGGIVLW